MDMYKYKLYIAVRIVVHVSVVDRQNELKFNQESLSVLN